MNSVALEERANDHFIEHCFPVTGIKLNVSEILTIKLIVELIQIVFPHNLLFFKEKIEGKTG